MIVSGILVLFGVLAFGGPGQFLFTIPEITWEGAILGIYLIVKGFQPAPIIAGDLERPGADAAPALVA